MTVAANTTIAPFSPMNFSHRSTHQRQKFSLFFSAMPAKSKSGGKMKKNWEVRGIWTTQSSNKSLMQPREFHMAFMGMMPACTAKSQFWF